MSKDTFIDARRDQLKILKLERRQLRPMAAITLDKSLPQKVKLAAVASTIAVLVSLQDAPYVYADHLGVDKATVESSSNSIDKACDYCNQLAGLVKKDASESQLLIPLEKLFSLVDSEHERLESISEKVGAKLLSFGNATGTGGKPPNQVWLNEQTNANKEGRVTGTGGKPPNLVWLNDLKAAKSDGKVTGTGGKSTNSQWLSRHKASERSYLEG